MPPDTDVATDEVLTRVRTIVEESVDLLVPFDEVGDDDDLFAAGLTSLALVRLLMVVEDAFDAEFPDEVLAGDTFSTINSIAATVAAVRAVG
ncbi:MAG TPA: acyl carrier protein [Acidimicrobiales bacterium]